jgi:P4 family phage/plasmid primase-like protien
MPNNDSILEYAPSNWRSDVKEYLRQILSSTYRFDVTTFAKQFAQSISDHGGSVVFCKGRFWEYINPLGIYCALNDVELKNILYDIHETQGADDQKHRLKRSQIVSIIRIAADQLTDDAFFDSAVNGIACGSSFLTIEDRKVVSRNHSPSHRARHRTDIEPPLLPVVADIDHVRSELAKFMGSLEAVDALFEIIGVAIFGLAPQFATVAIFVGEGANGKSTLVDIISGLFPPSTICAVPFKDLKQDYHRVELDGNLLNACNEFSELNSIELQWLKQVVSGEPIQVRRVRENAYTLRPKAQHIACTNVLPQLTENTEAMVRRLRVFRFRRIIPVTERKLDYARIFVDQYGPILLDLACEGAMRALERDSIAEPDECVLEKEQWLNRSNCVRGFVRDCLTITGNPKDRVTAQDMYEACRAYAEGHDLAPPSSLRALAGQLEARGLRKIKSDCMQWVGVTLREVRED